MTAKTEKTVKRIMIIVLLALFASICAMPYVIHRDLPESPLIKMHQQMHHSMSIGASDADAQVVEGGTVLGAWLLQVGGPTVIIISAVDFLIQVGKLIAPWFYGRPGSQATYCVTNFLAHSMNKLVQMLSKGFTKEMQWGNTLSSNWWNYAVVAKMLCSSMESKCGVQLGDYVCQSYLNLALSHEFGPCISSSPAAANLRNHFDGFTQCQ